MNANQKIFDVAVIGAGVVGSAIAAELSHYQLSVALIEAKSDVGMGTSKANTAIFHTGFDAKPGSLESKLLQKSYPLMKAYAEKVGIPVEYTGAILVAWTDEELAQLPHILEKARENGVHDLQELSPNEIYQREANLGPGVKGGLLVPGEAIICPYTPPLAYAYEAAMNGVQIFLNTKLSNVEKKSDFQILKSNQADICTRWVINSAGLYSDVVNDLFEKSRFKVTPRKGELIVYDKFARKKISHILLPVPTKTTKGVLISPTVFGNVLLGPTAEDLHDKEDTSTSRKGLESLMDKGQKIMPSLRQEEVTATYAGLRAATEHSDYQIFSEDSQKYICVGGIRSTGLSASLGIAKHVAELLTKAGLSLILKENHKTPQMPFIGQSSPRPSDKQEMILNNPDYGRIVCFCEQVSEGEIKDALSSLIPAPHLDGLRRRTRCLQGRCQGFYCLANISALLSEVSKNTELR